MIRALRRWHGRAWLLLALAVGPGLVLAVRARPLASRPPEGAGELPASVAWSADGMVPTPRLGLPPGQIPVQQDEGAFQDPGSTLEIYQQGEALTAVLRCDRCAVEHPDPVAYWAPRLDGERLPADARLLGGLLRGRTTLTLPAEAAPLHGELLIYSLGHGVVVSHQALGGGS